MGYIQRYTRTSPVTTATATAFNAIVVAMMITTTISSTGTSSGADVEHFQWQRIGGVA